MTPDQLLRQRKNTVKARLTHNPADWLLARYDTTTRKQTGRERTAPVRARPMYELKSIYETGGFMRITASDYDDTGRWWL